VVNSKVSLTLSIREQQAFLLNMIEWILRVDFRFGAGGAA
jgi:hypothetical protein